MNLFDIPELKAWRDDVERVGNRVVEARLLWKHPESAARPFACVLWAKVWVVAEGRYKANEFVFSRTDIAVLGVVDDSRKRVLMVREFRTPCRSRDGLVTELPGGSIDEGEKPLDAAIRELGEETGVHPIKVRHVATRQVCATLSSFKFYLYRASVSVEEMNVIAGNMDGMEMGDGEERTYVQVYNVDNVLDGVIDVDWMTYGAVANLVRW